MVEVFRRFWNQLGRGSLLPTLSGLLAVILLSLAPHRTASAENRVALVIGNQDYVGLPQLNNPLRDAVAMSAKLRELDFEVLLVPDANQLEMLGGLWKFEKMLAEADIGLAYFAGHGIQDGVRNYLIPVDAELDTLEDLPSVEVTAKTILDTMRRVNSGTNILILDACRNNPLAKPGPLASLTGGSRSAAKESVQRGLTRIDTPDQISGGQEQWGGVAILYAAAFGEVAKDGPPGGNGIFTGELLRALDEPGLPLSAVFERVSKNVSARTSGFQQPWMSLSISGEVVLRHGPEEPEEPDLELDLSSWNSAQSLNTVEAYEAYIAIHPNGRFVTFARLYIDRLEAEREMLSAAKPAPVEADPKNATVAEGPVVAELPADPAPATATPGADEARTGGDLGVTEDSDSTGNTASSRPQYVEGPDTQGQDAGDQVAQATLSREPNGAVPKGNPSGDVTQESKPRDALLDIEPELDKVAILPRASEPTLPHGEEIETQPASGRYVVVTGSNLRAGPSTDYEILGSFRSGQRIDVTGKAANANWLRFKFRGHQAWIAGRLVTPYETAARRSYRAALQANSVKAYADFLKNFDDSSYAPDARNRLAALQSADARTIITSMPEFCSYTGYNDVLNDARANDICYSATTWSRSSDEWVWSQAARARPYICAAFHLDLSLHYCARNR